MALPALAILGIASGAKALLGAGQAIAAGRRKEEPKYEIPKEVGQAIGLAQGMAQEGMPEAQRMAALQNIQQSAVMGMRGAQDRRGGLASIGNVQAQQDRSVLSLAAQDAAARQQNQRFLYSALMAGAQYQDKAFANRWQSWMNREQQRRALIGAGIQNIGGAVDTFTGGMMQLNYMNALTGGAGGSTASSTIRPVGLGSSAPSQLAGRSAIMGSNMPAPRTSILSPRTNPSMSSLPGFSEAMQDLLP